MEHCNRLAGRLLVDTRQSLAKPGGRCRCWADTPLIHALPAPLHFVLFLEPAASMTACSLILEGECKRMQKVSVGPALPFQCRRRICHDSLWHYSLRVSCASFCKVGSGLLLGLPSSSTFSFGEKGCLETR